MAAGSAIPHPTGRSGVRWVILFLLFLASAVAYLLRTNMSIAGDQMSAELGFSRLQLGEVLAAFAWGYAIFQFPGGVLGDRIGGRRALAYMALAWGGLNLLVGLLPGTGTLSAGTLLLALMVLRFLMGAAQAPLYPVTGGGTTCAWFPVNGWALPNGMSNAGLTLGSAAAGPLIVWLIGLTGWRMSFVLTAPLGLLMAAVWYWYARDTPAEHPAVSASELALIDKDRPHPPPTGQEKGDWREVLRNPQVRLLAAGYFCSNYLFYFFFNWLFIYLIDNRHFKAFEGGMMAALPWIFGAVGALIGGFGSDILSSRIGKRWGLRIAGLVGLGLGAVFIILAASARSPYAAVAWLSLCLGFQQMTEGSFWASSISVAGRHASAACGVLNTGGNVVGGLGALLVPVIVEHLGWPAALGSASAFALAGAVLWLFITSEPPVEAAR
ncbi:MAG TPA: MFS transporter [Gemmatimonadales bacterium]|nr:MFS transporter [Gemmatimonadales bacterium]